MTGTGFNPGEIGGYIISALESKKPLSNKNALAQRLKEKLIQIQKPSLISIPNFDTDLPNKIAGLTFNFESNLFGLEYFQLSATNMENAYLVLGLKISRSEEYGERKIPLGMEGQYVISNNTRFKTPMAAKAQWLSNKEIEIDYNDFCGNHKYRIKINFNDFPNVLWEMFDEAGFGETLNLKAQAAIE